MVYPDYVVQGAFGTTASAIKKKLGVTGKKPLKDYLAEEHRVMIGEAEQLAASNMRPDMTKEKLQAALKMAGQTVFRKARLQLPKDPSRAIVTIAAEVID